jgi:hypothetical protein
MCSHQVLTCICPPVHGAISSLLHDFHLNEDDCRPPADVQRIQPKVGVHEHMSMYLYRQVLAPNQKFVRSCRTRSCQFATLRFAQF